MHYEIRSKISSECRQKLNKYSDVLAQLLYTRGFKTNEEAEEFLNLNYDDGSNDPMLLKDIDIAVDRIIKAITGDEKICIFSDYDADGIPGAVILSDFFKKIGFANFFVYIPHRNREGFGLNNGAIDKITEKGVKLIITIDCGISNVEQIQKAKDLGVDVIITDHHDPNGHEPSAIAVVNPKQKACQYPDENLCGAGVVFKLVQALISRGNFDIHEGWEKWLLDMVGIATLSDMVPLVGENRVLAKYGILVMKKSPRKGFCRLLKECRVSQANIAEDDVGFSISPRINAASRMDEPEVAYRMLCTDDDVDAERTVKHLHKLNNERKGKVATIVKEIKKEVDKDNPSPIVVKGNPNWQPSLLGLVASSIVDDYKKPVFLWGRGDGHDLKGSCRSDGTVNLVEIMSNVKMGVISEFGGHKMAGGFIVLDNAVHTLQTELEEAYDKSVNDSDAIEVVIDDRLSIADVSWNLFNDIQKLAPFGVGNEKPVFLFEKVIIHSVSKFGKGGLHTKLLIEKGDRKLIPAIKFFTGDNEKFSFLKDGQIIDLVASLEKSNFGRYPELRLKVIDVF